MVIFLVEDEYWALAELKELFKRYSNQHEVYAFQNGDDALEAAEKIPPDLVITDITMPGINGLELIDQLKRNKPNYTKFVLLTVHDEFKYAQMGLKLGVDDYLVKPVKKDELYSTVDKVILNIENEKRERKKLDRWYLKQFLMYSSENAFYTRQRITDYYLVYLLAENWLAERGWQEHGITNENLEKDFFSLLSPKNIDIYAIDIDNRRKLVYIPIFNHHDEMVIPKIIQQVYHQMTKKLTVHVSYEKVKKGTIPQQAIQRLEENLKNHMRFGYSTFLPPNFVKKELDLAQVWSKARIIQLYIKKGDIYKCREVVKGIVHEFQAKKITLRQLETFVINVYFALTYNLFGSELNMEWTEKNFEIIQKISDYYQLFHFLDEMINAIFETYNPTYTRPKNLIPKIVEWIHNNYNQPVTFQDFANEHHVSLSYLSREFKNQTGYTFLEYLTNYRMKKAKEFIDRGIDRVNELCNLVGYEDPKYFSMTFKKIHGVSPSEYMRKNKSDARLKSGHRESRMRQ